MKKILVLCEANTTRSQMAEGYLRFFTSGNAEVFSAGITPDRVPSLAVKVMLEDNIDIAFARPKVVSEYAGYHFDHLITVCGEVEQQLPTLISYDQLTSFKISDPETVTYTEEKEKIAAFVNAREEIKREMLRFIGRHDELKFRSVKNVEG